MRRLQMLREAHHVRAAVRDHHALCLACRARRIKLEGGILEMRTLANRLLAAAGNETFERFGFVDPDRLGRIGEMRAGGVPKLGLLAFDERVADFAVGDLRSELGRGEAPVEAYQTGARAGSSGVRRGGKEGVNTR